MVGLSLMNDILCYVINFILFVIKYFIIIVIIIINSSSSSMQV